MRRGFTLAEIVIVVGIIAMSAGLLSLADIGQLLSGSFRSDRDALVVLLQHARAQAMANVCMGNACTGGVAHGVKIIPNQFVLFQGDTYATREPEYDATTAYYSVVIADGEVVFEPLSGDASATTITVADISGQRTSIISIGNEGQIFWTH
jgi:prepilin-type N-terminal cleavage/methylation domain-containing protein